MSVDNDLKWADWSPGQLVSRYVAHRGDLSVDSTETYEYRLGKFEDWCESVGIETVSDIDAWDFHRYEEARREADVRDTTLNSQLCTLTLFFRWAEGVAVPRGFSENIPHVKVNDDDWVREEQIDPEKAAMILEYLRKFEYASRRHVEAELLWEFGCRVGSIHSLDVGDIDFENRTFKFRNRPETGTTLKNGDDGERNVNASERTMEVVRDYLDRDDAAVEDEHGRRPLLTSSEGRVKKGTIRRDLYKITRPCHIGNGCPHDRDLDNCRPEKNRHASECPSSSAAHPWRRGSITHQLREGVPIDIVCGRVDVSRKVLEKHYDLRTEEEKAKVRRMRLGQNLEKFDDELAGAAASEPRPKR